MFLKLKVSPQERLKTALESGTPSAGTSQLKLGPQLLSNRNWNIPIL